MYIWVRANEELPKWPKPPNTWAVVGGGWWFWKVCRKCTVNKGQIVMQIHVGLFSLGQIVLWFRSPFSSWCREGRALINEDLLRNVNFLFESITSSFSDSLVPAVSENHQLKVILMLKNVYFGVAYSAPFCLKVNKGIFKILEVYFFFEHKLNLKRAAWKGNWVGTFLPLPFLQP